MDRQTRNDFIRANFVKIFTLTPQLMESIRKHSLAAEQSAMSLEPSLNDQMGNLENEPIEEPTTDANVNNGLISSNQAEDQPVEQVSRNGESVQNAADPIELLLQPNASIQPEQRTTILAAIRHILHDDIHILKETAHDSWVCVHNMSKGKKSPPKVILYCPHPDFEIVRFHENEKAQIDTLFKMVKGKARNGLASYKCSKANSPQDQFFFVLVFALCIVMGQSVDNVDSGLRDNAENVRKLIVKSLLDRALPSDASNKDIWLQPVSINRDANGPIAESNFSSESNIEMSMDNESVPDDAVGKRDAIKQLLQSSELSPAKREFIVSTANRMLPENIRILRDSGHDGWVCVHYDPNEIDEEKTRVYVYYPYSKFENSKFKEEDKDKIVELYEKPGFNPLEVTAYRQILENVRNVSRKDALVFTLASAFSIAMGQKMDAFKTALGVNNSTEHVRKVVAGILLKGATLDTTNANVWIRS
ncbi:uncharacterized protein LOC129577359 isoform X2 [Sitodiplosis mosellana]|uniref:uncharacterized protein LOC129577359 isoform X2 n=1 Tax=Sitodiplosis mosellana TaxID=263140 RepID=UPI00244380DC|nr:uncharacterized protein LOC129577359 isoform X2 [Sitodiplosis mosellana]